MEFSEVILFICNSFKTLAKKSEDSIVLLSGREDPFRYLNNEEEEHIFLSDYQKKLYEMILNYKILCKELNKINEQLEDIIDSKTKFLKIFAYFVLTFDTALIICNIG